jgi:hypothetical protein
VDVPVGLQPHPASDAGSFTAALQKIAAAWAVVSACEEALLVQLITIHLGDMAKQVIGDRPDRVEPRAVKRRPKPHKLLTKPRPEARAELVAGAQN